MSKIFISYRREDSADITARISDRLRSCFGPESIFIDIDQIPAGADFRDQIHRSITPCQVCLVVIGQRWLTATDEEGNRRLDDSDDWVRMEIRFALQRGIPVVPILVHGAEVPEGEDLPEDLRNLSYRQAEEVRSDSAFNADVGRLIRHLERYTSSGRHEDRFQWECVLVPVGILFATIGALNWLAIAFLFGFFPRGGLELESAQMMREMVLGTIVLGGGAWSGGVLMIVCGKWLCCWRQAERRRAEGFRFGMSLPAPPQSPKAIVGFSLGLASFGLSALTAVPAVIISALALLDIRQRPGTLRGKGLAVMGVLFAALGCLTTSLLYSRLYYIYQTQLIFDRGTAAIHAGEYGAAVEHLNQAIGRHSGYPLAEKQRGIAYTLQGDYQLGLEDLSSYLKGPPIRLGRSAVEAYFYRSQCGEALGLHDRAVADLERARDIDGHFLLDLQESAPPPPPAAPDPAD